MNHTISRDKHEDIAACALSLPMKPTSGDMLQALTNLYDIAYTRGQLAGVDRVRRIYNPPQNDELLEQATR